MTKTKWNYAVVRSVFGDYWVGKTKLKADEIRIFADIEDVIRLVEEQFLDEHPDFDPDLDEDDEDFDEELFYRFEEIREHAEEPDEIQKSIEKFIVKLKRRVKMAKLFKFSLDILVKAKDLEQAEIWAKEEFGIDVFESHILITELEDNHFNQEIDIDLTE